MNSVEQALLESEPVETLAVLADPQWRWDTRSWMSAAIVDQADDVLNEKLDALIASTPTTKGQL